MRSHPHICMLAAENDSLPGGKVGGIGDVIRDLPAAVANTGARVSVVMPAYGIFHRRDDATFLHTVHVPFMGRTETVAVYTIAANNSDNVQLVVLEHDLFSACGSGEIYCNDPADQPFATDANKFALFSRSALAAIADNALGPIDVLHLHDWHAAFAAILARFDARYQALQSIPLVFSIHNLAMQGVRPISGHASSWNSWFPDVVAPHHVITDPRWHDCINPMAAAIRLCDKVHTVSPTYALEIQQANDPTRGFHGGEGLEADLSAAAHENRLCGILNGTNYPPTNSQTTNAASSRTREEQWRAGLQLIGDQVLTWLGETEPMRSVHYMAHQRCISWRDRKAPKHIVTSVGRLTEQKMAIPLCTLPDNRTAFEKMLQMLADDDGVFILLGTGDPDLEKQCQRIAAAHANCLFLNRYAAAVADVLFAMGDLFFMPSSFEPCGISQMVAMRHGQLCLVHGVGGLRDTIVDNVDGFQFSGDSPVAQAEHCLQRFNTAIALHSQPSAEWESMQAAARSRRFSWTASVAQYREFLYNQDLTV